MDSKQLISPKQAAEKLAAIVGGKVWDKKEGEFRVYVTGTKGYLRIAPATTETAQVQYFLKSYEISKVKPAVAAFNDLYTVSASISGQPVTVLMQEDEDGVIAPVGQHEAAIQIVREWTIER